MSVSYCARPLALLLLLVSTAVPAARAQEADTLHVLPEVTVTAARAGATPTLTAPARVTVLDDDAVEASGARTIAELLTARTGVFVKTYGDAGLASLSLRGTGASHTLVLLDGHRIADPQLGQLDLSLLPTLLLRGVEVMHGAASPLYGTDGMGGVVNLRTRAPGAGPAARVSGGVGAYGEHSGGMLLSGGGDRLSGLAVVEYAGAEGDYPYLSRSTFPPRHVPREGADRRRLSLYASTAYRAGRGRLRLSGWYADAERGLPTVHAAVSRGERQWDESLRLWADHTLRRSWGRLRVGGLVQQGALRYVSPQLDLDETGRTRLASVEVEAHTFRVPRWLLTAGLAAGRGAARHPRLSDDAHQLHGGLFLDGTGDLGRVIVYPSLRVDAFQASAAASGLAVSPRLGVNVRPSGQLPLRLKANAGHAFRAPTLNDRFWQPGGNPDLHPERGWTGDAGLMLQHPSLAAELTAFVTAMRDQIVWLPSGQGYWAPENVRRTRTLGLEASLQRRWRGPAGRGLDAGLFYTLTDARDRSDPADADFDQPLRYVPRQQLKLNVSVDAGPLVLDLAGRHVGRRYVTTDGSAWLDPFVVVDAQLRASHRLGGLRAHLSLALENVLDADYAVLQNHPMPPRHARVRLVIETGGS